MKKSLSFLCLVCSLFVLGGCSPQAVANQIVQTIDDDTIWVQIHFNIPEGDVVEDYYYYGRIHRGLYHKFLNGEVTEGMLLMRDVRFWNESEGIVKYEDEEYTGSISFRLEHVMKVTEFKKDPYVLQKKSDAEPAAE